MASQIGTESESGAARIARRIRQDRQGGAAFEFALMVPMLTAVLLGIVQYGTLFYTYHAMTGAARTAVRAIAIGSQNAATAKATALTVLPKWVPSADFNVAITDGVMGAEVSAEITVDSDKAAIIPYLPMPDDLVARVVMIKEG
jgi:Flp pilus assembly protein TadG